MTTGRSSSSSASSGRSTRRACSTGAATCPPHMPACLPAWPRAMAEQPWCLWQRLRAQSALPAVRGTHAYRIKELSDTEQDIDKKMALRKVFRALNNVRGAVMRAWRSAALAALGPPLTILPCGMRVLCHTPHQYQYVFHIAAAGTPRAAPGAC